MSFSSFEPMEASCGENGYGFLYLLDTFTGLPSPEIYYAFYTGDATKPSALEENQVAGVLTTGSGTPTEAYITATAMGLTSSASAPDMSIHSIELTRGAGPEAMGITSWKEVLNYGFSLEPKKMVEGLSD
jgi:Tfp pilus tip-associated adhesin PilY1